MDALHKLTQMAEEIFGLDAFCTGKQIHKQKENLLDLLATSESSGQNLSSLSILNDLLSSLLQVGQLYAHQGAVREALRQFVDGVALARQFCLPYRHQAVTRTGKRIKHGTQLSVFTGIPNYCGTK